MPSLINAEKLNNFMTLGVQVGKGNKGTGYQRLDGSTTNQGKGVWTVRIKFPKQKQIMRTTGVKYSGGVDENGKKQATNIAFDIFSDFSEKASRGIDVTNINYIHKCAERYKRYMDEATVANEAAKSRGEQPFKKIIGGKSYWSNSIRNQAIGYWNNYLDGFILTLPKRNKTDPSPVLEQVDPRDLDTLDDYVISQSPKLAIETRLKVITEMRHFLYWAYEERIVDRVHPIRRPQRGGKTGARERMRKEITPDMYLEMVKYSRARYTGSDIPQSEKDYAYIFHLWFLIMANCGIRCPTGGVDHTLVRWEHLKKTNYKGQVQWTLERKEKGIPYEAIILPPAYEYWTALEKFYQSLGMTTKKGYVFTHPHNEYKTLRENVPLSDKDGNILRDENNKIQYKVVKHQDTNNFNIQQGAPIKSFKARFNTMCGMGEGGLGYNASGTKDNKVAQSERVSPTSLRAWFITQRLYSSDDIKIEFLARACGTSIGQIEARYLRLDMSKTYEYLSAGAYDAKGKEAKYDGVYYQGRK